MGGGGGERGEKKVVRSGDDEKDPISISSLRQKIMTGEVNRSMPLLQTITKAGFLSYSGMDFIMLKLRSKWFPMHEIHQQQQRPYISTTTTTHTTSSSSLASRRGKKEEGIVFQGASSWRWRLFDALLLLLLLLLPSSPGASPPRLPVSTPPFPTSRANVYG